MTIVWDIDPENKLIAAVAIGDVTREELVSYLDDLSKADCLAHAKLFDGSEATTMMSPADVLDVAARFRDVIAVEPLGPLALVLPADGGHAVARLLGVLATAKRPMRIFRDAQSARRWLRVIRVERDSTAHS